MPARCLWTRSSPIRRGFEVELPQVPLGRLYGVELDRWLNRHGVELVLNTAARRINVEDGSVRGVELRDDRIITADWFVSSVPHDRLLDLLPAAVVDAEPAFGNLRHLETSPITSVHLWYDRPFTPLPHVVLIDCLGQWLFRRGATDAGEHYYQVVVSAARMFRGLGHEEVQRRIVAELARLFPGSATRGVAALTYCNGANGDVQSAPGCGPLAAGSDDAAAEPLPGRRLDGHGLARNDGGGGAQRLPRRGGAAAQRGTPAALLQPDLR